ncbi:MAG: CBS domain-containing protein [Deltaproteobacteria bacterium]|nr:CBS domain-containing protein [Deltaproteobacteria bacterium]
MIASDVMTRHPVVASSEASVGEVLEILRTMEFRHLPIVDGNELVGIVSDRDLRGLALTLAVDEDALTHLKARLAAPIADLMSTDVVSVAPEDEIGEVIDLMIEHRVGAIPVVDESSGDLVGIVSYIDVLRETRGALE